MEKIQSWLDAALKYLDSGKLFKQPLQWLYYIIGVLCIGIPYLFYDYTHDMFWRNDAAPILMLIVGIIYACVFVYYWFNRAKYLNDVVAIDTDFVAIPVVAALIRDLSVMIGVIIATFMPLASLVGFLTTFEGEIIQVFFISLIGCPIAAYVFVLIMRAFAENILALAAIANNTKSIDTKTR